MRVLFAQIGYSWLYNERMSANRDDNRPVPFTQTMRSNTTRRTKYVDYNSIPSTIALDELLKLKEGRITPEYMFELTVILKMNIMR